LMNISAWSENISPVTQIFDFEIPHPGLIAPFGSLNNMLQFDIFIII